MQVQVTTETRGDLIAGKVNKEVKKQFRKLARSKGMNVSTYLNAMILRELRDEGITFEVRRKFVIL